jgi:hypothetical protein
MLAACFAFAWPSPSFGSEAEPSEASLRDADAMQMRIIVDEDVEAQRQFMHENYIINGPANRVMRKAEVVNMLAQGKIASDSFERTVEGIAITDRVGIVMGTEIVTPSAGSQLAKLYGGIKLHRRFTNVFLWENGKWRFLARQATIVQS